MGVTREEGSGVEVEVERSERRRLGVLAAGVVEWRSEGEERRRGETDFRGDSDLTRERVAVGEGEGLVCCGSTVSAV